MKKIIVSLIYVSIAFMGMAQDEALTVDAEGNVGINNSSPEATLDVSGNVKISEDLIIEQDIILDGNLDSPGIITADQFKMNNGMPLIQMVEYWKVGITTTLGSSWTSVASKKGISGNWHALFPGYTDMEILFFFVSRFGSNKTTIETRLRYHNGTDFAYHNLSSFNSYSYGRNYRFAGSILLSEIGSMGEVYFQQRIAQGSDAATYDVYVVYRPKFD